MENPNFTRQVALRVHDRFNCKCDIGSVLEFILKQKVPGNLVISLPGNGGITSIEFVGKEQNHVGQIKTV